MLDKKSKSEEELLLQEFAIKFSEFLKQNGSYSLFVENAETSKFNSLLQIREKSWEDFQKMTNIDIHYEFQNSKDYLKIHLEANKENLIDVKRRHELYEELQRKMKENKFIKDKYGLRLSNLLNDNRSCNQLCKFLKIKIDKNNIDETCKNIITLNGRISEIFSNVVKNYIV
ncbi:MAG: hypothetical protein WA139_02555 [Candidatus Aenigmatarchaeota archaeon]